MDRRLKKHNILFIAPHRPDRAPSQRFRFEQYLDFLKGKGFDYKLSFLISGKEDAIFYSKGKYLYKLGLFIKYFLIRLRDVLTANSFDIVFIQREAFFVGPAFFEFLFHLSRAKLVFDFDDSIWLANVSEANKSLKWIKNYQKTIKIIRYSKLIIAGNQYLESFAGCYNKNTTIIPTTINTDEYKRITFNKNKKVCIGWSGSVTTIQHFNFAIPFLKKIKLKYKDLIYFKVIGDDRFYSEELNVQGVSWEKQNEILELSEIDIGLMPLPNDEWAKGKCGLKGLQYMALGIPTIMSPVGVNTEIIQSGVNGFLANTNDEWIEVISKLIESPELRLTIGQQGRKTVIEKYSVQSQQEKYLRYFQELSEK